MSPEKKTKHMKNENDENLPFDIYDSVQYSATTKVRCEQNGGIRVDSKSAARVLSNTNNASRIQSNEYDEDDEEDFIKIYFASGTVLKPSDEPYNLRSKIDQANQELANDKRNQTANNAPGKVKFDNTVVVLDSFEDIGTVSIGTEKLQGSADVRDDAKEDDDDDDNVLAKVDLLRRQNEEDDQNDVICSTAESRTLQDTDTDEKVYSSTSFSRSFSSESDDPLFVNMIETGDEFKSIMDRNNKTRQGSAIDEHVTYFPELFTHTQYKMYEHSGKTADGGDSVADDVNIYVPRKLDADELRDKLKAISKERKRADPQVTVNDRRGNNKSAKKIGSFVQNVQRQMKKIRVSDKKATAVQPAQPQSQPSGKPRTTYYFELDPKGKLKPLNKNETNPGKSTAKFFHINLKAAKHDENAKPRITKTPNTDLFLEFQTDRSGNKGAKLVIKKKPMDATDCMTNGDGGSKRSSIGHERPRLPGYNGLRSEYGLSAEQLLERRRIRMERERRRKEFRQQKHEEEQRKRAENEKNFYKWLQQKKQLKKQVKTRHCYPTNRLTVSSARASVNSIHNGDQRKGSFALEELLKIKDENSGWFKF